MEIVVCVTPVPEGETRLRPNAAQTDYDAEGVKFVLAGYDESAVEQALLLKEATPGSRVRVVTFGPGPRSEEILRAALALGCDAATWVEHPSGLVPDALLAARSVAHALRSALPELVLCGRQSGDEESGLFPGALATALGFPAVGYAVDVRWDAAAARLRLGRAIEGGVQQVETPLPVVIALQQAWNDPRTAKLPNILKSRKAPIDRVPWDGVAAALGEAAAPTTERRAFRLPPPRTGAKMIAYDSPEDAAQKLVRVLREEAKVFP